MLTETVTQMTSLDNANNSAARSTADPENFDSSDSGEEDGENDRQNRVTIYETDRSFYNENNLAASLYKTTRNSAQYVKVTGCFIKLLLQLPKLLKTKEDANQNLVSIRKKILFSDVSSECKDLGMFTEDINSHLFGEELEDSLKKAKERHYSLQVLKPNTNYRNALIKGKFHENSKKDRPNKKTMAGHKDISQYNSPST